MSKTSQRQQVQIRRFLTLAWKADQQGYYGTAQIYRDQANQVLDRTRPRSR